MNAEANVVSISPEHVIHTRSGRQLDLEKLDPKQIDIDDIAWGLVCQPINVGHTSLVKPLCAAQKSVWVASYCWLKSRSAVTAMHALLSDAHIGYIGAMHSGIANTPWIRKRLELTTLRIQLAILEGLHVVGEPMASMPLITEAKQQFSLMQTYVESVTGGPKAAIAPNIFAAQLELIATRSSTQNFQRYKFIYTALADACEKLH